MAGGVSTVLTRVKVISIRAASSRPFSIRAVPSRSAALTFKKGYCEGRKEGDEGGRTRELESKPCVVLRHCSDHHRSQQQQRAGGVREPRGRRFLGQAGQRTRPLPPPIRGSSSRARRAAPLSGASEASAAPPRGMKRRGGGWRPVCTRGCVPSSVPLTPNVGTTVCMHQHASAADTRVSPRFRSSSPFANPE